MIASKLFYSSLDFLTIVNKGVVMSVLPQEIQVWYVLPALRRELAVALINRHGLPQKKVAKILGISEGAVSQYVSYKRGASVKFEPVMTEQIELAAGKIEADNTIAMSELLRLSEMDYVKKLVCQIHRSQEPSVGSRCSICFRG